MPQRDVYHDAVKQALIKDGWTITHDPLLLTFGGKTLYVDLGAEGPIGAEKEECRIAVEVKSFLGRSEVADLEQAIGQFAIYRAMLRRREPGRRLYLAVPEDTWQALLDGADARDLLSQEQCLLMVFHPEQEVIVQWLEPTIERL
ncbi:MAG: element excision factor XisH family protein [Candidatus Xenobia bacterium]